MNEIQNVRVPIYAIILLISGCTIILQSTSRSKPMILFSSLMFSSFTAFCVSYFVLSERMQSLCLNLSLMMPFIYLLLVMLDEPGSSIEYMSPCRRIFYQVIQFVGVVAGLIPHFGTKYFPLDVTMGVAVFLQAYCIFTRARWIEANDEEDDEVK